MARRWPGFSLRTSGFDGPLSRVKSWRGLCLIIWSDTLLRELKQHHGGFMLEMIRTENQTSGINQISQPACEVSQFIKNFSDAVHEGNSEEISSYFSDEMKPVEFSQNAQWTDETILIDDHVATFSCTLQSRARSEQRLTCVLDKSEGYWQIIHAEVRDDNRNH
jgi:hemerythrin-like domain-containing protein